MLFLYTHIQGIKADRFRWSAVSSFRGGMIPVLLVAQVGIHMHSFFVEL